jgi:hypothetical protein
LDHILFWTAADIENKLLDFKTYFNNHRTHTSETGERLLSEQVLICQSKCSRIIELRGRLAQLVRAPVLQDFLHE